MTSAPPDTPPKLDVDWVKTLAGALAAVTTAVLLSTLGAAGTLIGAAIGSVAATIGSAIYAQGLARSRAAVLKAQEVALHRVGIAQAEVRRADRRSGDEQAVEAHLGHADEQLSDARAQLAQAAPDVPTVKERLAVLPWKRIALAAVVTFAAAMIVISGFEKATGRSVSSYTGGSSSDSGSTVPGVNGSKDGDGDDGGDRSPSKDPKPSDEITPSDDASEDAPTPSAEPTTEAATPTPTPSSTPTPSASATPTPQSTPTAPSPSAP